MSLTKIYESDEVRRGFSVNYVVYLNSIKLPNEFFGYVTHIRVWRKPEEFGTIANYSSEFFSHSAYTMNDKDKNESIDGAIELYLKTKSKESKQ